MLHHKILLFTWLLTSVTNLSAQQGPGFRNEIGIAPFALEWNNETLNQPIAPKGFYRVYYNRYFNSWAWTNSIGYGKNNIKDDDGECLGCPDGSGRMEELIVSSGWRFLFMEISPKRLNGYLEAGAYYADYRYIAEFTVSPSSQVFVSDFDSETLGAYGEVGVAYSPMPRVLISASTKFKAGKDFFGADKGTAYGLTIVQLGIGFFPFQ